MRGAGVDVRLRKPRRAGDLIITGGESRALDTFNTIRLDGHLTAFINPPPGPPSWPTNAYGINYLISPTNQVLARYDLVVPPAIIPESHWVLSGHGTARVWLLAHASIGTQIGVITL